MPSSEMRSGRARWYRAQRRHQPRAPAPGLADFAGDCIAAPGGERGHEGHACRVACVASAPSTAAPAATPVLAIALPAPRRPPAPLRDAELRLPPQAEPRGQDGQREGREQQHPSAPSSGEHDRDPKKSAADGSRYRDRARDISRTGYHGVRRQSERQRAPCRGRNVRREILADERRQPKYARRPLPEPKHCHSSLIGMVSTAAAAIVATTGIQTGTRDRLAA